ncbi:MAG TPA: hypothetical protein VK923_08765 [Euzebyales bacterium]|nr:hypothetical protein [Euzebyales bacterium]
MNPRPVSDVDAVVCDAGEVLIDETRVWHVWAELLGVTPLTFAAALGATIVAGDVHHAVFDLVAPDVDCRALEAEHERRYGGFATHDFVRRRAPDARGSARGGPDGGGRRQPAGPPTPAARRSRPAR